MLVALPNGLKAGDIEFVDDLPTLVNDNPSRAELQTFHKFLADCKRANSQAHLSVPSLNELK